MTAPSAEECEACPLDWNRRLDYYSDAEIADIGRCHDKAHAALAALRAENERLRIKLESILDLSSHHYGTALWDKIFPKWMVEARRALEARGDRT